MRQNRWPIIWMLASGVLFACSLAFADGLTPAQIARRTIPSVVTVRVPAGLGSGFVAGNGLVVTNLHVLGQAREATVVLADGRELQPEVLAADEGHDLLVLKVAARGLRPLPLGDARKVHPGDRVVAIGHPLGLSNTVSDGLVSAIRQVPQGTMLQLSAPIAPGSSGGPLIDDRGRVIGVSTLLVTAGQNLAFAVPIDAVKPLLKARKATPLATWNNPAPVRQVAHREERPEQAALPPIPPRAVPSHPAKLLDGCSADERRQLDRGIEEAIENGAPLYNHGNAEACFRIYQGAALDLLAQVKHCSGPKKALAAGLDAAGRHAGYVDKVWAMRDAFDGLLEVIRR
jgi:serine protease Do